MVSAPRCLERLGGERDRGGIAASVPWVVLVAGVPALVRRRIGASTGTVSHSVAVRVRVRLALERPRAHPSRVRARSLHSPRLPAHAVVVLRLLPVLAHGQGSRVKGGEV